MFKICLFLNILSPVHSIYASNAQTNTQQQQLFPKAPDEWSHYSPSISSIPKQTHSNNNLKQNRFQHLSEPYNLQNFLRNQIE